MVKINLLIIFILFSSNTQAQKIAKEIIKIDAEIVSSGIEGFCKIYCNEINYFTKSILTNQEDTAIKFFVMTCSWQDSWLTDNDSIWIKGVECDSNYPDLITLQPGQSMTFYGIVLGKKELKNKYFRLGFVMFSAKELMENDVRTYKYKRTKKVYWSNTILLEGKTNSYIVNER